MMAKLRKTGNFRAHVDGEGTFSQGGPLAASLDSARERPVFLGHHGRAGKRCTRVLIIDDNMDAADSLRDLFLLVDAEVEVAYDGLTGIAKAKSFRPDLVMCDIGLPGMNGYEVVRILRQAPSLSASRIFAWTGYSRAEDVRRCAEAGFHGYLAKPLSSEQLAQLLRLAEPF